MTQSNLNRHGGVNENENGPSGFLNLNGLLLLGGNVWEGLGLLLGRNCCVTGCLLTFQDFCHSQCAICFLSEA